MLDQFNYYHLKLVIETALLSNIKHIFLPLYLLDLNPIEFIWKSIRRVISTTFIDAEEKFRRKTEERSIELQGKLTFAKMWAEKLFKKL